jgi:hypothetical protein
MSGHGPQRDLVLVGELVTAVWAVVDERETTQAIANAKEDLLLHMRRLRAVAEGALRVAGIKQENIVRVLEDMYGGEDE